MILAKSNNIKAICFFVIIFFTISSSYSQQPVTITEEHRSSYPSVKNQFTYSALGGETGTTSAIITAAKTEVADLNIVLESNGIDVSGNAIPKSDLLNGEKMLAWSKNMQALALAAQTNTPDPQAKTALIKLTKHLLKQCKINGCDGSGMSGRDYTFYWEMWKGWLCAMPVFQTYDASVEGSELALEALAFIKKVYNYEAIHANPFDVNDLSYATGDFIYTHTRFLFCMAAYNATVDEQIEDYIRIQRLYENYAVPRDGGIYYGSGIWIDGTFAHHGSAHSSYFYQLRQWIDDMWKMRSTAFAISLEAYNNIANGVYSFYLQTTDGAALASTLGGRNPLNSVRNWMLAPSYFINLVKMGGLLKENQAFDPEMAAKFNYLTNTRHTFDVPAENLDGFHQMNYSGMGLYRGTTNGNRWVATMRGFTSKNWGAEFINRINTFGRYQSHGVLEIIYSNDSYTKENSGYPSDSKTWDWNVIPGTTTVHHSPNRWHSIQVINSSSFSWQKKNFVGALTNGASGIFAMDYEEDPVNGGWGKSYNVIDNLKFKKTVFSHNNIMVCLGSNIQTAPTTSRPDDKVCTNLFQFVYEPVATPKGLYLNGSKEIGGTIVSSTNLTGNNWLISPSATGYYIPEQSGSLELYKGKQSVPQCDVYPRNNSATEATYADKMVSQDVAKSWIAHPAGTSKYEFVVVPGTTPAEMMEKGKKLGSGKSVYSIVQQDEVAHVVNFDDEDLNCYAIFQASTNLPSPLVSATKPCLILVKPVEDGYNISICTPDLNPQINSVVRPKGWLAGESLISFKIKGYWELMDATDKVTVTARDASTTTVSVILQHGLNETFKLTSTPTSIINNKSFQDRKLLVYPNPCENFIRINGDFNTAMQWEIVNLAGQLEKCGKTISDVAIDVSSLNSGVHIVTVKNHGERKSSSAVFIKN
ncbi:polysaccharide lyase family 8 super-sandwich domain-containing protein [Draconibacterium mangrovi]|uniref:polysaccharide lyase family 8 super-sandwich domain-containing protein n=1 Tax=Draconibacterium mangrovi TaxID=2697469 RepID=UPI0013D16C92|nr:polysaccharide lyase family 8 super-sandwich domain-containing protein [Draconibacterium mangrovi]